VIREVIDQRGDVADVIVDYTDSERSDISHDEYVRVTGDLPGLVLFEGWISGDPDALAQIIATLAAGAQEPRRAPELATAVTERDKARAARNAVCNLLDLFGAPDERLMQHASVTRATLQRYAADAGVRLDGRAGT
jgi:hypothetical protein